MVLMLLAIPGRGLRGVVAGAFGVVVVLATVVAALDLGFEATIDRAFSLAEDLPAVVSAFGVVGDATGTVNAILILALLIALLVGGGDRPRARGAARRARGRASRSRRPHRGGRGRGHVDPLRARRRAARARRAGRGGRRHGRARRDLGADRAQHPRAGGVRARPRSRTRSAPSWATSC